MSCLDDYRLFAAHTGDAAPEERAHLTSCAVCAGRLRTLRADLVRIDTVLRETTPPPLHRPRGAVTWRWAPLAVAAVLALALGVQRWGATPDVEAADDTLALAQELSAAIAPSDYDLDDEDDASTVAAAAESTCTWGDPLLGVGCEEPAVMRIAWR
jgi:hypothetical protein